MSDISLSYAREDRTKARTLADLFEECGWTVWWDQVAPRKVHNGRFGSRTD